MQTETITRKKLTASKGMYLTDGEVYGKEIFLSVGADTTRWREITENEYSQHLTKEAEEREETSDGTSNEV